MMQDAESEKPRQRGSIAVRKVFARIRKVFAVRYILPISVSIYPKTGCKLSGQSRNCPDNPKTIRIIQKLSGQSKNCLDNPKTIRTIQELSGQSKNCPDNPETVRTIQKLSGQSKNCPDNPKTVWTI